MIPYGRQCIEEDDIEAVVRVLRSDYLTTGPEVQKFEEEFAKYVGAKYAVAVSSGTAALHLAMIALGIGPGDRVVTSANTFVASANCALYVGAKPDFCDIELVGYNMDPEFLEENWKPDTKAVVAVDYAGQPANMPEIGRIARERGAYVVEDASHAVGSEFEWDGKRWKVGGHPWADLTTFSFHPVKTMTTGEGGMVATDDPILAEKIRKLRHHGIERDPQKWVNENIEKGPWYYEMQELGFNYRLTDIQCALGRSQLKKLDRFIERRQEIVLRYNEAFSGIAFVKTPKVADWLSVRNDYRIAWHLYSVGIDFDKVGVSRESLTLSLRRNGIGAQVLYIPVSEQNYLKNKDHGGRSMINMKRFYKSALSLPLYANLGEADLDRTIHVLKNEL
ncbi:MAG: UDP-4-amino-4,6-dideoxy-N-acetyl-beta-L-altrosamine transaminase [Opitutales bacterium]|nr:UDP-4-amino-4,6-dideoxy-N-acetyl-beta-L-altrosamine transaminase [Opitutales bacterium]